LILLEDNEKAFRMVSTTPGVVIPGAGRKQKRKTNIWDKSENEGKLPDKVINCRGIASIGIHSSIARSVSAWQMEMGSDSLLS
jgi:hypothetical protein